MKSAEELAAENADLKKSNDRLAQQLAAAKRRITGLNDEIVALKKEPGLAATATGNSFTRYRCSDPKMTEGLRSL